MKTDVLEKLFMEKFPEYTVHGKPLAHYFELFKGGYELSELKIAELEDEVESWKKVADSKVNWDEVNEYSDLLAKLAGLRQ